MTIHARAFNLLPLGPLARSLLAEAGPGSLLVALPTLAATEGPSGPGGPPVVSWEGW